MIPIRPIFSPHPVVILRGWFFLSTSVLLLLAQTAAGESPLLVTVGEVTDRTAVIWGRGFTAGPLTVEIRPAEGGAAITSSTHLSLESDFTGKLPLTKLQPATRYRYTLRHGKVGISGTFMTAPSANELRRVHFLWSGDLGGGGYCRHVRDGYKIFRSMLTFKPDFFLFVGDTVYADDRCGGADVVPGSDFIATSLEEFRAKHRYNRADPHVQDFFGTTSVYAIWDDHEVRNNFAGPTEPLTASGLRAFIDYWPLRPPMEEPGRLYRKVRWGKLVELFILDTRQYRSDNRRRDGQTKTMLGPAQREWLLEGVTNSDAVWKVVVSSVPLAISKGGRRARDSWSSANPSRLPAKFRTGFSVERDAILKAFRERGIKNLVWVTADVHHGRVVQHRPWPDFSFHELIAGPLSASRGQARPLDVTLNPQSLFALDKEDNFGEVTVDPRGLTVRIYDASGAMRFEHTIAPDGPP